MTAAGTRTMEWVARYEGLGLRVVVTDEDRIDLEQPDFALLTMNAHLGSLVFEENPRWWLLICGRVLRAPLWQFPCLYDRDPNMHGLPYLPLTGAAVWVGTRFELPTGAPEGECCRWFPDVPAEPRPLPPLSELVDVAEAVAPQYLNEREGRW